MRPRIEISVDEIVLRGVPLSPQDVPAFRRALEHALTSLAAGGPARPAGTLGAQVASATWAHIQRAQRVGTPGGSAERAEA